MKCAGHLLARQTWKVARLAHTSHLADTPGREQPNCALAVWYDKHAWSGGVVLDTPFARRGHARARGRPCDGGVPPPPTLMKEILQTNGKDEKGTLRR